MQIHFLAARGDTAGVLSQLDRGIDIDARDHDEFTPLMRAAGDRRSSVAMLELLTSRGANPNACSNEEDTCALGLAAKAGEPAKVERLLRSGARPRVDGSQAHQVLIDAAYGRAPARLEVVRQLIEAGADLNATSSYGESPLLVASRFGEFDLVRELLSCGADAAMLEWTPLMHAIVLGTADEVSNQLSGGASLTHRDHWRRTPLLLSAHVGDVVKAQIVRGQSGKSKSYAEDSSKAMMLAAMGDHADVLSWLISEGAEPNAADDFGYTPLMWAATWGAVACARILLSAGADVNRMNDAEEAAIHAIGSGVQGTSLVEILRTLVAAGADLNSVGGQGYCVLQTAASHHDPALVSAALAMGASPDATRTGETALHAAVAGDDPVIVRMLLDAGANPNARDVDGYTPLFCVQTVEVARMLIDAGADASLTDDCDEIAADKEADAELMDFLKRAAG